MTIFDKACSSMDSYISGSYTVLDRSFFPHHLTLANEPCDISCILYFQRFFPQYSIFEITYILFYIYGIKYIWEIVYTIYMNLEIKVFGDKAKQITEGQKFIARIGSVEGRTVVTLMEESA